MKKFILSLLVLPLFFSTANAFDVVTPDYGGQVERYESRLQQANRAGTPIRIGSIECDSSCTLFLAARNVCVSPNAVLGFHAPWYGGPDGGVVDPRMVANFARHYKPGLRRVFLEHVARSGNRAPGPMLRITGRQLASYGYRLCSE